MIVQLKFATLSCEMLLMLQVVPYTSQCALGESNSHGNGRMMWETLGGLQETFRDITNRCLTFWISRLDSLSMLILEAGTILICFR